jgi:hypothetical protein
VLVKTEVQIFVVVVVVVGISLQLVIPESVFLLASQAPSAWIAPTSA